MDTTSKYPSYPEQKYDPSAEQRQADKCGGAASPSSSPHGHGGNGGPLDTGYHGQQQQGHSDHDRAYLTPPAPGHVSPDTMRDIKPVPAPEPGQQPSTNNGLTDTDKDLSESSIDAPDVASSRSDDKDYAGHNGAGLAPGHDYQGSGYYGHHADLSHPSYGGYSTAGPFPLSSPLSRPRSNKNKANSGKRK